MSDTGFRTSADGAFAKAKREYDEACVEFVELLIHGNAIDSDIVQSKFEECGAKRSTKKDFWELRKSQLASGRW